MRIKIISIFICILVVIGSAFTVAASMSIKNSGLLIHSNIIKNGGNTLIADTEGNRVIEVDNSGTIVWKKTGLNWPQDAERLPNGNTLITEIDGNRVIEVDSSGTIVWQKTGLSSPIDAERLVNGNTVITELYNNRVIEVDSGGTVIWLKTGLSWPTDAERLENGNTLITEYYFKNRVIEVDSGGTIVWQKTGLSWPFDAERLENGNTLIAEPGAYRVIEVNSGGTIVWQLTGVGPMDVERLENGNTLITGGDKVTEYTKSGTVVWSKTGLNGANDGERIIDYIPGAPIIDGPHSGVPGEELCWDFHSEDPNNDQMKYIIEWGDETSNETEYYPACTPVEVCHTYESEGTYIITATAEDETGLVSDESTFRVTIPRTRIVYHPLPLWLLERFPMLERLLNLLRWKELKLSL
jgi:hypothetical protein